MQSVISHNNNFTFVDLRTHYDERLLRKFYNDFLVPNFSVIPDELDPIDVWIDALCDPNPRDVVGHVVLAFENLPTSRRAAPVTRKVSVRGLERNPVSNIEDEPQAINSNETNNSESPIEANETAGRERARRMGPLGPMVGGCCFEYIISSNTILLSYFCVDPRTRGKGLSKLLANSAEMIGDSDARIFRHLPRVDGFFLETNKLTVGHQDVMNPRERHAILYNLGFRAINFGFIQPPLSPESKPTDCLWLCVRVSSPHCVTQHQKDQIEYAIALQEHQQNEHNLLRINKMSGNTSPRQMRRFQSTPPPPPPAQPLAKPGTIVKHYIPSALVKNFVIDYWMSCVGYWKTDVHRQTEDELRQMVHELDSKRYVELLDLPWDFNYHNPQPQQHIPHPILRSGSPLPRPIPNVHHDVAHRLVSKL